MGQIADEGLFNILSRVAEALKTAVWRDHLRINYERYFAEESRQQLSTAIESAADYDAITRGLEDHVKNAPLEIDATKLETELPITIPHSNSHERELIELAITILITNYGIGEPQVLVDVQESSVEITYKKRLDLDFSNSEKVAKVLSKIRSELLADEEDNRYKWEFRNGAFSRELSNGRNTHIFDLFFHKLADWFQTALDYDFIRIITTEGENPSDILALSPSNVDKFAQFLGVPPEELKTQLRAAFSKGAGHFL